MKDSKRFKAFVAFFNNDGKISSHITGRSISDLPDNDVLIKVCYSSLNYKDALSAKGNKGITRSYPHTPGIDAAGIVENSKVHRFSKGEKVLVTGYDLGMNTPGGFGEFISVPAQWVIPLPDGLSLKESMILGTAGFTAALSLHKLEQAGLQKGTGEIVVTGASGGVGTSAVAIFAKAGYEVVAVSGKSDATSFLKRLGAKRIVSRSEFSGESKSLLLDRKWSGAVDTTGGPILENIIKSMDHHGVIAACGLVASPFFSVSVYPFLLRGVTLCGIDSATCPESVRSALWEKLSKSMKPRIEDLLTNEIPVDALSENIERILNGKLIGRTLVKISDL